MTGGAGTPRYMAPEVAKGESTYGFSVDVYSFSILLWQIVTKRTPYERLKSRTKLVAKVVDGNVRPNLAYVESEQLRNILENGWTADPGKRHTFSHIRQMLENYLRDEKSQLRRQRRWSMGCIQDFQEEPRQRISRRHSVCEGPKNDIDFGDTEKPCQSSTSRDHPVQLSIIPHRRRRRTTIDTAFVTMNRKTTATVNSSRTMYGTTVQGISMSA